MAIINALLFDDRSGAILGDEELASASVTLRDMRDGTQQRVSQADAAAAIRP